MAGYLVPLSGSKERRILVLSLITSLLFGLGPQSYILRGHPCSVKLSENTSPDTARGVSMVMLNPINNLFYALSLSFLPPSSGLAYKILLK